MEKIINKAVEIAGSQSSLARQIGVSQPRVWNWIHNVSAIPAEYVLPIEKVTGISRYELRPDIYSMDEAV
tara:strand:+ start:384 stop:593 length:210 start_codon:yes stop_codon:yes gene_type:complete